MPKLTKDQTERLTDKFKYMQRDRDVANSHWQEIADVMHPEAGNFYSNKQEGEKVMSKIYDSSPMIANQLLASAEFSLMTSPSNQWFKLEHSDPKINRIPTVALWFEHASKVMFNEIHRPGSGFTSAMHESYLEFNPFGNMAVFVDELVDTKALRFQSLPLAETFYSNNEVGDTVGVYRRYDRTIAHLVERFGPEGVHENINKKYNDKDYTSIVSGVHAIYPREIAEFEFPSSVNMPYASIWVDTENKYVMAESGYREQPFASAPFFKAAGKVYGQGPGSIALPSVKMLMRIAQTTIRAAQKAVDPPLMVPDSGFFGPTRTYAGGMNYYQRGTKDRIEPLKGADPKLGVEYMEYVKKDIKQAFYVDQLQLGEGPQMTATEVIQRTEERLRLMGPWLGRLQTMLGLLLFRVYRILRRSGKIAPPPQEVAGTPIKTVFTSPIARSQEQIEAQGLMRSLEVVAPIIEQKPGAMDVIEEEETVRGVYEMFNVSQRFLRTKDEVKQVRAARAKAEKERADAENLRDSGQGAAGVTGLVKGVKDAGAEINLPAGAV